MKSRLLVGSMSVLALVGALVVGISPTFAAGQTCVWTGAGADNNFSTVANWSACAGAAPTAGDIISFGYDDIGTEEILNNDLNVSLAGVTSAASAGTPSNYKTVYLSSLRLQDGGTISGTTNNSVSFSVNTSSSYETRVDLVADGDVTLNYDIQYKNIVAAGDVTVGPNAYYSYVAGDQMSKLIVQAEGSANFYSEQTSNTVTFPIELNGGSNAALSFGAACGEYGQYYCASFLPTNWIMTGATTVNAQTKVDTSTAVTAYFAGAVNDQSRLVNGSNAAGEFKFGTPETAAPSVKENIVLDGETTGFVTVTLNQIATLTGKRGYITVAGELKGTGTITGVLTINAGAKVAPGMSPGCLTTAYFNLSGEYVFELGGNDPCSGYDQVKVTEPADDSVFLGSNSVITTSRYNDFTPKQNQVFTIIDNQGAKAVTGTFKDLPEGATFTQNGVVFKVSYVGGNGNDVTLTVMNQPTAPNTGFELIKANPLLTLGAVLVATLSLAILGRRLQTQR